MNIFMTLDGTTRVMALPGVRPTDPEHMVYKVQRRVFGKWENVWGTEFLFRDGAIRHAIQAAYDKPRLARSF